MLLLFLFCTVTAVLGSCPCTPTPPWEPFLPLFQPIHSVWVCTGCHAVAVFLLHCDCSARVPPLHTPPHPPSARGAFSSLYQPIHFVWVHTGCHAVAVALLHRDCSARVLPLQRPPPPSPRVCCSPFILCGFVQAAMLSLSLFCVVTAVLGSCAPQAYNDSMPKRVISQHLNHHDAQGNVLASR